MFVKVLVRRTPGPSPVTVVGGHGDKLVALHLPEGVLEEVESSPRGLLALLEEAKGRAVALGGGLEDLLEEALLLARSGHPVALRLLTFLQGARPAEEKLLEALAQALEWRNLGEDPLEA